MLKPLKDVQATNKKTSNIHELQNDRDLYNFTDCKSVINTNYLTSDQFLNESTGGHDLVVHPLNLVSVRHEIKPLESLIFKCLLV